MNLFQHGSFTLHSGFTSPFRIEGDALAEEDWETVAFLIASQISFQTVEGVPRGGLPLAEALLPYCAGGGDIPLLIVDDVFTTGTSLERQRDGRDAYGVVLFARVAPMSVSERLSWIHPLFVLLPLV